MRIISKLKKKLTNQNFQENNNHMIQRKKNNIKRNWNKKITLRKKVLKIANPITMINRN